MKEETRDYFLESVGKFSALKASTLGVLVGIFTFHFVSSWYLTGHDLTYDYIELIIQPARVLPETMTFDSRVQINFYQGVLFYLYPVFAVIGQSPNALKAVSLFFMAAASSMLFLVYKKIYDFRRALLMVLILLTMGSWITHRSPDNPIIFFLSSLVLYNFVMWREKGKNSYLYTMAFLSGIAFYTKGLYLYFFAAIVLATILVDRETLEFLDLRNTSIFLLLFSISAAPFFIYSINQNFSYLQNLLDSSGQGATELSGIFLTRAEHLTWIIGPLESSLTTTVGGWNISVYLLLLFSGLVISIYSKRERFYALAVILIFFFTHYAPYSLDSHHLVVMSPLIPIIIVSNFEIFSEKTTKVLESFSILILVLVLVFNVGEFAEQPFIAEGHLTQDGYEDITQLDLGGEVVTNSRHGLYLLRLHENVKDVYVLAPEDWGYHFKRERYGVQWSEADRFENSTKVLMSEPNCEELVFNDRCGYNLTNITEFYEEDKTDFEEKTLGRFEYVVSK